MGGGGTAPPPASRPQPGPAHPGDVVGRYHAALDAGDTEAVVSTFAPDGYYREPIRPPFAHRGASELRSYFSMCFSAGGGIGLQHCAVTDDGVRCAREYNCVRWGSHDLPPQAGIAVSSAARTGCWVRLGSTTTWKHLSTERRSDSWANVHDQRRQRTRLDWQRRYDASYGEDVSE
jgi:hypothetical protein